MRLLNHETIQACALAQRGINSSLCEGVKFDLPAHGIIEKPS